MTKLIVTRIDQLEEILKTALDGAGATSDEGCSALANVLLGALVSYKKNPLMAAHVSHEMYRLADKLRELAASGQDRIDRALSDAKTH